MAVISSESGSACSPLGLPLTQLLEWNLYLPNVVPAIQLSVLKHRSEHKALTVTTDLALFFLHLPMDSRRDVAPFTLVYIHLSVI